MKIEIIVAHVVGVIAGFILGQPGDISAWQIIAIAAVAGVILVLLDIRLDRRVTKSS